MKKKYCFDTPAGKLVQGECAEFEDCKGLRYTGLDGKTHNVDPETGKFDPEMEKQLELQRTLDLGSQVKALDSQPSPNTLVPGTGLYDPSLLSPTPFGEQSSLIRETTQSASQRIESLIKEAGAFITDTSPTLPEGFGKTVEPFAPNRFAAPAASDFELLENAREGFSGSPSSFDERFGDWPSAGGQTADTFAQRFDPVKSAPPSFFTPAEGEGKPAVVTRPPGISDLAWKEYTDAVFKNAGQTVNSQAPMAVIGNTQMGIFRGEEFGIQGKGAGVVIGDNLSGGIGNLFGVNPNAISRSITGSLGGLANSDSLTYGYFGNKNDSTGLTLAQSAGDFLGADAARTDFAGRVGDSFDRYVFREPTQIRVGGDYKVDLSQNVAEVTLVPSSEVPQTPSTPAPTQITVTPLPVDPNTRVADAFDALNQTPAPVAPDAPSAPAPSERGVAAATPPETPAPDTPAPTRAAEGPPARSAPTPAEAPVTTPTRPSRQLLEAVQNVGKKLADAAQNFRSAFVPQPQEPAAPPVQESPPFSIASLPFPQMPQGGGGGGDGGGGGGPAPAPSYSQQPPLAASSPPKPTQASAPSGSTPREQPTKPAVDAFGDLLAGLLGVNSSEAKPIPFEGNLKETRRTGYAPGVGGINGGWETQWPNLEGLVNDKKNPIPRTLDDVRLGKSRYVTLAGKTAAERGKYFDIGSVTYKSPLDSKWYTGDKLLAARGEAIYSENLAKVYGYVHDSCGSCVTNNHYDIAVGDFRGWDRNKAVAFVVNQPYFGNVRGTWRQVSSLPAASATAIAKSDTGDSKHVLTSAPEKPALPEKQAPAPTIVASAPSGNVPQTPPKPAPTRSILLERPKDVPPKETKAPDAVPTQPSGSSQASAPVPSASSPETKTAEGQAGDPKKASSKLAALPSSASPEGATRLPAAAKQSGEIEIPELEGKVVYLTPFLDPKQARAWKYIIIHQTEGAPGLIESQARAQAATPGKTGTTFWVETDGTVYVSTREDAKPIHVAGLGANRSDNKYLQQYGIDNKLTFRKVTNDNSIGIEFGGNGAPKPPGVTDKQHDKAPAQAIAVKRPLTQAEIDSGIALVKFVQERYNIPPQNILAHEWVDQKDPRYCEGCSLAQQLRQEVAYTPTSGDRQLATKVAPPVSLAPVPFKDRTLTGYLGLPKSPEGSNETKAAGTAPTQPQQPAPSEPEKKPEPPKETKVASAPPAEAPQTPAKPKPPTRSILEEKPKDAPPKEIKAPDAVPTQSQQRETTLRVAEIQQQTKIAKDNSTSLTSTIAELRKVEKEEKNLVGLQKALRLVPQGMGNADALAGALEKIAGNPLLDKASADSLRNEAKSVRGYVATIRSTFSKVNGLHNVYLKTLQIPIVGNAGAGAAESALMNSLKALDKVTGDATKKATENLASLAPKAVRDAEAIATRSIVASTKPVVTTKSASIPIPKPVLASTVETKPADQPKIASVDTNVAGGNSADSNTTRPPVVYYPYPEYKPAEAPVPLPDLTDKNMAGGFGDVPRERTDIAAGGQQLGTGYSLLEVNTGSGGVPDLAKLARDAAVGSSPSIDGDTYVPPDTPLEGRVSLAEHGVQQQGGEAPRTGGDAVAQGTPQGQQTKASVSYPKGILNDLKALFSAGRQTLAGLFGTKEAPKDTASRDSAIPPQPSQIPYSPPNLLDPSYQFADGTAPLKPVTRGADLPEPTKPIALPPQPDQRIPYAPPNLNPNLVASEKAPLGAVTRGSDLPPLNPPLPSASDQTQTYALSDQQLKDWYDRVVREGTFVSRPDVKPAQDQPTAQPGAESPLNVQRPSSDYQLEAASSDQPAPTTVVKPATPETEVSETKPEGTQPSPENQIAQGKPTRGLAVIPSGPRETLPIQTQSSPDSSVPAKFEKTAAKLDSSKTSITDFFKQNGLNPSPDNRARYAEVLGIENYDTSGPKNEELRKKLAEEGIPNLPAPTPLPYSRPTPTNPYATARNYGGDSIVDFLDQARVKSDFAARANLARQNGITNYTGSGSQNIRLLNILRSKIR